MRVKHDEVARPIVGLSYRSRDLESAIECGHFCPMKTNDVSGLNVRKAVLVPAEDVDSDALGPFFQHDRLKSNAKHKQLCKFKLSKSSSHLRRHRRREVHYLDVYVVVSVFRNPSEADADDNPVDVDRCFLASPGYEFFQSDNMQKRKSE